MTIKVKVITHSINRLDEAIASVQARYPRYIHSEVMTHRKFSRNASSSRAIPVERLIEDVLADPVDPPSWFKNKKGMQGTELLTGEALRDVKLAWGRGRQCAVDVAWAMHKAGAHKQHVNRVLEPYAHINVLITSTDWNNFFGLRWHGDAQPEIQTLAKEIYNSLSASKPKLLLEGEWHLPYITDNDWKTFYDVAHAFNTQPLDLALKCSVARCARVSYLTHEFAVPTVQKDLDLYAQLIEAQPLHASPTEHQAMPDPERFSQECWGNFKGWIQHRKLLPNEYIETFTPNN